MTEFLIVIIMICIYCLINENKNSFLEKTKENFSNNNFKQEISELNDKIKSLESTIEKFTTKEEEEIAKTRAKVDDCKNCGYKKEMEAYGYEYPIKRRCDDGLYAGKCGRW